MGSALGLGLSSPGWGHCVMFLDKTLFPRSAYLHPNESIGISKLNAGGGGGKPCDGLAFHPGGSRNTPSGFMLHTCCIGHEA